MYKSTTVLQSSKGTLLQDFPLHFNPNASSKQTNNLKDNGLPKIPTKVALENPGASRVAAFLGKNNLVLSENVVRRPMTAITVTRRGEIKHKVVSAPVNDFRKSIQGQDNTERVFVFSSDHQKTLQQEGLSELDSQNELSKKLSKLSVLQSLDGTRTSFVGKNANIYNRNKNIHNCGGNANNAMAKELQRFSKNQQTERLPLIGEQDSKKNPRRIRTNRGNDLENHLKKANEDYDENVQKASMIFNYIESQNKIKESTDNKR